MEAAIVGILWLGYVFFSAGGTENPIEKIQQQPLVQPTASLASVQDAGQATGIAQQAPPTQAQTQEDQPKKPGPIFQRTDFPEGLVCVSVAGAGPLTCEQGAQGPAPLVSTQEVEGTKPPLLRLRYADGLECVMATTTKNLDCFWKK